VGRRPYCRDPPHLASLLHGTPKRAICSGLANIALLVGHLLHPGADPTVTHGTPWVKIQGATRNPKWPGGPGPQYNFFAGTFHIQGPTKKISGHRSPQIARSVSADYSLNPPPFPNFPQNPDHVGATICKHLTRHAEFIAAHLYADKHITNSSSLKRRREQRQRKGKR